MIPATSPYYARYRHDHNGHRFYDHKRVIAWGEDGEALVVDDERGELVRADSYRNFDGLSESDNCAGITSLIPAGEWRVIYTLEDGREWSEPLVGWGVREDGSIAAFVTDPDGIVHEVDLISSKWRLTHPDITEPTVVTADDEVTK